jgi:hypothetical protein
VNDLEIKASMIDVLPTPSSPHTSIEILGEDIVGFKSCLVVFVLVLKRVPFQSFEYTTMSSRRRRSNMFIKLLLNLAGTLAGTVLRTRPGPGARYQYNTTKIDTW